MTPVVQDEISRSLVRDQRGRSLITPTTRLLARMVCSALLLRTLVAVFSFVGVAAPSYDHGNFGAEMGWIARSLASGHGFGSPFLPWTGPTALVPPLFPFLLAAVFHLFGIYSAKSALAILSIDGFFSALTCIPIYVSLRQAIGERPARLAGWLWVVYPFAIFFSATQVWDYALTSFLFTTCFCFSQRLHLQERYGWWGGFGILYGVTALSNPSILSIFPFLLLLSLRKVRRVGGQWMLRGVTTVMALLLVVGPWMVRNDRVMHAVSPVRDGFWLEFWAGNAGDTYKPNPAWAHPASNPVELQRFQTEGERAYLAHKQTMAVSYVVEHPLLFAGVSVRRVVRFWTGFWSFQAGYLHEEPLDIPNVCFCTFITVFMVRGMWRWWKEDREHALPYLISLVVFPLPYYLTHSSMDYRQPIEPLVLILVALGLFGSIDRDQFADSRAIKDSRRYRLEPHAVYRAGLSFEETVR